MLSAGIGGAPACCPASWTRCQMWGSLWQGLKQTALRRISSHGKAGRARPASGQHHRRSPWASQCLLCCLQQVWPIVPWSQHGHLPSTVTKDHLDHLPKLPDRLDHSPKLPDRRANFVRPPLQPPLQPPPNSGHHLCCWWWRWCWWWSSWPQKDHLVDPEQWPIEIINNQVLEFSSQQPLNIIATWKYCGDDKKPPQGWNCPHWLNPRCPQDPPERYNTMFI